MKLNKNKKPVLIALGILLMLLLAALVYFLPILDELTNVHFFCLGSGCRSGGGGCGVLPCPQPAECHGYRYGLIVCFSDLSKYCKVAHPFESIEKCGCEAFKENEMFRDSYRKFCDQNKVCYTNSWEYEFGCAEDMQTICKKAEGVFTSPNACESWYDTAQSYGFVKRAANCSQSWVYIYSSADEEQKRNIYGGFIGDGTYIQDLCMNICENCASDLCNESNICGYVKFPINSTSS